MQSNTYRDKLYSASNVILVLVSLFFVISGFLPKNLWWGINHLVYLPDHIKVLYLVLIGISFLPPVWQNVLKAVAALSSLPRRVGYLLAVVAAILLFTIFRDLVHSTGDSYVRANEITRGILYLPSELLGTLVHAILFRFLNLFGQFHGRETIAITSIIIGALFVILVLRTAPMAGRSKGLFVIAALSMGSSQLFFGYVESYALLYLFIICYLLLAFKESTFESFWNWLTLVYLLAGLSHQIGMILLLPSYVLLSIKHFKFHPVRVIMILVSILIAFLPYLIPKFINFAVGHTEIRSFSDYFLPFHNDAYSLVSLIHLFDILNLFILVAPILVILAPMFLASAFKSKERSLLPCLIIPAILFIIMFKSDLTLVRDWDLFSIPVAVITVPLLILLLRPLSGDSKSMKVIVPALLVASIIFSSWVLVNNRIEAHLERAEYMIDKTVKGQRYGYENLNHYFVSNGRYEDQLRVLMKIKVEDRTPRIYGQISMTLWMLGRKDEAYQYAMEGVAQPKPREINALMAGLTSFEKSQYFDAARFFDAYIRLNPADQDILWKLGQSLLNCDSLQAAKSVFDRMLALNNRNPQAYYGLAGAYYRLGDFAMAERYGLQAMEINPNLTGLKTLLKAIQGQRQELEDNEQ